MLKTEALKQFLSTVGNRHLTSLYKLEMEVQVNVAKDNGTKIGGDYQGKRWTGWTDATGEVWKSFRIPWRADSDPTYTDTELKFNLLKHVEGIGMTGWDWKNKQSLWVGFDFDSLANHKEGLTDEELETIRQSVMGISWVTLVKSTSGKGLHVYVHLSEPVPTTTHSEHAALARSILSILSIEVGHNFNAAVDVCGHVLWIYHRKQEGTDGLTLLKEGSKLNINKIPINWKNHLEVVTKKRKKIKINLENEIVFEELLSSIKQSKLDSDHNLLLKWFLTGAEKEYWWDTDNNMLVCHTWDLKKAHSELKLKGIFYTNSSGSSSQNCYAFPIRNGAWVIRRHSLRVKEHPSWSIDSTGWTKCFYNTLPEFSSCCRAHGGLENTKGEYIFPNVLTGLKALTDLGIVDIVLPENVVQRPMALSEKSDGKIIVTISRETSDKSIDGFLSNKRGDKWEKVIWRQKNKKEMNPPDNLIRYVISNGIEAGWWIFTNKSWIQQNKSNAITVLISLNENKGRDDVELMMSKAILNPWELVNIPFSDEYPGDRKWNKEAAKFACRPIQGSCDTWLKVIRHIGTSLDQIVINNQWCMDNAITNGGDYLLCWIASMFQQPQEPLPYLFFMGEQESGKSTLHEALALLMTKGYVRADNALINQQGFNSEIGNAILCVVEETDLKRNKDAHNRIKDWVTGKTISINTKYKTVYDMQNTTHWMQCANDYNYCPILPGDTRIVAIKVNKPDTQIPKSDLFNTLEKEKTAFLNMVLSIELPEPEGRLAIPVMSTYEKTEIEKSNSSELEIYIKDNLFVKKGHAIVFSDFYDNFLTYLSPELRGNWSKQKVSQHFILSYPICKGKMGEDNVTYIGNMSFDKKAVQEYFEYYTDDKGRLQRRMYGR